jgi:hypothetical protein
MTENEDKEKVSENRIKFKIKNEAMFLNPI